MGGGDVLKNCLTLWPLARPRDVLHSFRARSGCPHLHDHAAGSPRPRTSPPTTWGRGHTTSALTPQVRASPHGLELLDGTLSEKANTNKGWSTKPTHLRGDRVTTKGAAWEWGLCAAHWVSHRQAGGGGGSTNLNRYLGGHDLAQAHGGFVDAG
jgi:hypothetical protein